MHSSTVVEYHTQHCDDGLVMSDGEKRIFCPVIFTTKHLKVDRGKEGLKKI